MKMEEGLTLIQENLAILAPLFILQLILMVIALIDLAKNDEPKGPKWVWTLVIIFINIVGPIVYFIAGKRR
ncbi:PLDc_N domain-containing protein [Allobacillus salarius]|uniref:PLDc_N domain-containing protein n=2 Tax=Bacillaceae TaxID=186817 RepID=A0A556PPA0_9BACI|nr:PLDc_N domain-containing protein [Allobacillus salarius]